MEEIAISKFKSNCVALLERARKTGEPIRITRFGKPIADIVPVPGKQRVGKWVGTMEGTGRILGDIISPATDDDD